jgi:hypothetical protein
MTLVLSCFTDRYAIQVMDRRVTLDGVPTDDARNKGVSLNGQYIIGYSGLAEIAGLPSDEWIVGAVANADGHHPFDYLVNAADSEISKSKIPRKYQWTVFVALGWERGAGHTYEPVSYTVTNATITRGGIAASVQPEFRCYENRLSDHERGKRKGILVHPVGEPPTRNIWRRLERNFRAAVARDVSPKEIARILAEAIRSVADRKSTVGRNLVVLILPRPDVKPAEAMATSFGDDGDSAPDLSNVACYLLADKSDDFEWAMPSMAVNGWAFSEVTFIKRDSQIAIKAKLLRMGRGTAGIGMIDAKGTGARLEYTADGKTQIRLLEKGKPDKVLPAERKGPPTANDLLSGERNRI